MGHPKKQKSSHSFFLDDSVQGGKGAMIQRAKKVVSDSPGLVDFAIRLVKSVLILLNGQVNFWGEFKLKKDSNQSHLSKNFFRLVIMTLV